MGAETGKANIRRMTAGYFDKYFVGYGIDIGCGEDKLCLSDVARVRPWDETLGHGDAQKMKGVADNFFDFVYSSHCLEHVANPEEALKNWWRILKPGGYLFVEVPDEDLYEQGVWPSRFNGGHRTSWTIWKEKSWCKASQNVLDHIRHFPNCKIIKVALEDANYDYSKLGSGFDQSCLPDVEVSIEFILQKLE
jgi:SAM-dependent methyltransferase